MTESEKYMTEALAEAEKALPTVRSIILSGYDEFEFARQAV